MFWCAVLYMNFNCMSCTFTEAVSRGLTSWSNIDPCLLFFWSCACYWAVTIDKETLFSFKIACLHFTLFYKFFTDENWVFCNLIIFSLKLDIRAFKMATAEIFRHFATILQPLQMWVNFHWKRWVEFKTSWDWARP